MKLHCNEFLFFHDELQKEDAYGYTQYLALKWDYLEMEGILCLFSVIPRPVKI